MIDLAEFDHIESNKLLTQLKAFISVVTPEEMPVVIADLNAKHSLSSIGTSWEKVFALFNKNTTEQIDLNESYLPEDARYWNVAGSSH